MHPKAQPEFAAAEDRADQRAVSPPLSLKEKCRRAVASGLYHTGLLSVMRHFESEHELSNVEGSRLPRLRRSGASKFGILCYHRVGTSGVPVFSRLDPRVFAAQMRYLRKHYRIVPLGQLCRELKDGSSVKPTLAITFDDGYRDLYTHAFPVLQKYEIPATIYLIGKCMETGEAPWYDRIFVALETASSPVLEVVLNEPRKFSLSNPETRAAAAWEIVCYLRSIPDVQRRQWCASFEARTPVPSAELQGRMLNWEQVHAMQKGGVSFGAHTMTHPSVSRLESDALEIELVQSKACLEEGLQAPIEDFAYPFGKPSDCSMAAEELLSRSGYRSAVTTTAGCNTVGINAYRLLRMQIGDDRSISSYSFDLARMLLDGDAASHGKIDAIPTGKNSAVLQSESTIGL
jgi:peptidoglycan/xylan/chitin deacetylase (PgdA/CDA1 family)